ncbi:MAG: hypothetical protein ACRC6S_01080, partial [Shewanella sp.]
PNLMIFLYIIRGYLMVQPLIARIAVTHTAIGVENFATLSQYLCSNTIHVENEHRFNRTLSDKTRHKLLLLKHLNLISTGDLDVAYSLTARL